MAGNALALWRLARLLVGSQSRPLPEHFAARLQEIDHSDRQQVSQGQARVQARVSEKMVPGSHLGPLFAHFAAQLLPGLQTLSWDPPEYVRRFLAPLVSQLAQQLRQADAQVQPTWCHLLHCCL